MKIFLKRFGGRIRVFRLLRGFTQENIADQLDISASAYAKIERGESDINISRIEEIARIYSLTASQLISLTDNFSEAESYLQLDQMSKKDQSIERDEPAYKPLLQNIILEQIQLVCSKLDAITKRLEKNSK
jgi:transcriptional regulator with XRE-family HTH domain